MGTIATTTILSNVMTAGQRRAVILCTLSASYATGGDTIDLSALSAASGGGFTLVHGGHMIASPTAGNDKYLCTYVPAAAYAPATGLVKIRDASAASDAEVSNTTDLSAVTIIFEFIGK